MISKDKIITLNNGLKVALDHNQYVQSFCAMFYSNVGSRHESMETSGISHFIEHMAFKGSDELNAHEISTKIEHIGGNMNAWTSKDSTVWYCSALAEHTQVVFDVLHNIVVKPTFNEEEIVKERNVILQELLGYEDDPDSVVYDKLMADIFTEDTGLGRPVIGYKDTLNNIGKPQLIDYKRDYYNASNMIFVISGNFDNKAMNSNLELLSDMHRGQPQSYTECNQNMNQISFISKKSLSHAYVAHSYKIPGRMNDKYYSYVLMSAILGSGMSSRLFKVVREDNGMAYDIYSSVIPYMFEGVMMITYSSEFKNITSIHSIINYELAKLARSGPEDLELEKVKNMILSSLLMNMDSPKGRAVRISRDLMDHNKINYDYFISKIKGITKEDILIAAQDIFNQKPNHTILHNEEDRPQTSKVKESILS